MPVPRLTFAYSPMLTLLIHLFLGATLAGVGIVVALVLGATTALPIAGAGLAGFLVAFPVSHAIAKRLHGSD